VGEPRRRSVGFAAHSNGFRLDDAPIVLRVEQ